MHLVPLHKSDQCQLDSWFHTRARWIWGIRWEVKITNQDVGQRAMTILGQCLCPPATHFQLRLRAFGHFSHHNGIAYGAMVYVPEGTKLKGPVGDRTRTGGNGDIRHWHREVKEGATRKRPFS